MFCKHSLKGMPMHKYDKKDLKDSIIAEIRQLAKSLGHTPTIVEWKQQSPKHSADRVLNQFGTWNNAVEAAGLLPNPTKKPPRNDIPKQKIISELIRVANKLGRFPSHPVFSSNAQISRGPVEHCFGSWVKAKQHILLHHSSDLTFKQEFKNKKDITLTKQNREKLRINLPLTYIPNNELETLVLFSLLAEKLGMQIVQVQSEFPDLEIITNGQLKKAEIEYLSSNYLEHGHPLSPEILCICWRKNKEIPGVRIIDLESYVRTIYAEHGAEADT